jgi:hypothetical protein
MGIVNQAESAFGTAEVVAGTGAGKLSATNVLAQGQRTFRLLTAVTAVVVALALFTGLAAPSANAAPAHPASAVVFTQVPASAPTLAAPRTGTWTWWGYVLNRTETNTLANLSLWNAATAVKGTRLIPYSNVIVGLYAVTWVLTARNARSLGKCLAINYAGTGIIANCR